MKTAKEVSTKLKIQLARWFAKQCRNLDRDYYLYLIPQTAAKPSTLTILSGRPAGNHVLVCNERLRKHFTVEQNYSVLMDLLRKMPCLTID